MSYGKASELLKLALFLSGRTGATLADIEQEFECDRRRAQRMLAALRDLFPQLVRRIDDERHPRWSLPAASLAAFLVPTSDELAALIHAIGTLKSGPATPEVAQLEQLEAKIRAMVPANLRSRFAVDEEALLECLGLAARPGPRPAAQPEVDEQIRFALKARRRLRILYASRRDSEPAWRIVEPYGLLLGARRYLVAVDPAKGPNPRHYRVDQIRTAELHNDYFEPDHAFDLGRQAKKAFGSYERSEEYGDVIWRFAPQAAGAARGFLFHPDQQLEPQADGSLIVRFRASGHLEMAWHLYMWGDKVEVIAPAALKDMVAGYRRSDFPANP